MFVAISSYLDSVTMVGHDSKGSVESDWAKLGLELEAKSKGSSVVDYGCWATPDDGWAALEAELAAPSTQSSAPAPASINAAPPANARAQRRWTATWCPVTSSSFVFAHER